MRQTARKKRPLTSARAERAVLPYSPLFPIPLPFLFFPSSRFPPCSNSAINLPVLPVARSERFSTGNYGQFWGDRVVGGSAPHPNAPVILHFFHFFHNGWDPSIKRGAPTKETRVSNSACPLPYGRGTGHKWYFPGSGRRPLSSGSGEAAGTRRGELGTPLLRRRRQGVFPWRRQSRAAHPCRGLRPQPKGPGIRNTTSTKENQLA